MKSMITALIVLLAAATTTYAAEQPDKEKSAEQAEQRLEAARKRMEQAAREVAELSAKVATKHLPNTMVFLSRNPNRAMLGIGIGGTRETELDNGVAVLSVSPGGPAANAGLKTGDVIVELNGKSLKRDKEDSPREKLLEAMGKLSPGEDVTVKYLREGKSSTAKFKAEQLPQDLARRELRLRSAPGERRDFDFDFDFDLPHSIGPLFGSPLGDMEVVPLTPKLAQYFGAEKGLLVVRAPEGKDTKLEDGDVIIDIDGRVPNNAGHAYRIFASYQPGEKLTLNILRQRSKMALTFTMPERSARQPKTPRPARTIKPFNEPLPPPV